MLDKMSLLPNVHFLGGRPTKSLGAYPQHFDVCLMPYVIDDYTRYVYPLKMHEVGGKPAEFRCPSAPSSFKHVIALARNGLGPVPSRRSAETEQRLGAPARCTRL